ncbi:hypothetical protein MP228_003975 [Amoeboaphelidium protococcarum]|nr:hypothetical protein MP228_003975 [Amoeboaphelidium protococcarum]
MLPHCSLPLLPTSQAFTESSLKLSYTSCLPLSPLPLSDVAAQSCPLTASASGSLHSSLLLRALLPPPVHHLLSLWLMGLLDRSNNALVVARTRCGSPQCASRLLCVSQSKHYMYRLYLVSSTHHGYVFNLYPLQYLWSSSLMLPTLCRSVSVL